MSYFWERRTRLYEGPGERYEGRVSHTPIMGMVHSADCELVEWMGLPLFREVSVLTASLYSEGVRPRGIMTCTECDAHGTVTAVREGLRYLQGSSAG